MIRSGADLIYQNGSGITLATGANGANHGEQPPNLSAATSSGGTTAIEGSVATSTPSGTILDFYASDGLLAPAGLYLGSYVIDQSTAGFPTFTAELTASVPTGASLTATATSPTGDTSGFASSIPVANPLAVTNTNDSGVGSLRQALEGANQNGAPATIVFALQGTGPFTITLQSPLPQLTNPVTIDATGLETTPGSPLVVIDGHSVPSGNGLVLGPNSDGSTIMGLDLTGFAGDAIQIQSSNNLIQGDVIASNTGTAVDVASGTGNAIHQDLIYGDGSVIVLAAGANNNQAAPAILAVASVPNLTTIDYQVTGALGQSYSVDFYASVGSSGPAAQFLGTVTTPALTTSTEAFTAMFATQLTGTQAATATATDAAGRHLAVRAVRGRADGVPPRRHQHQRRRQRPMGRLAAAGDH